MTEKNDAFEQVETENEHVEGMVEAFAGDDERWTVEYDDGTARETGIAGLAWYAEQFDDEATVTAA